MDPVTLLPLLLGGLLGVALVERLVGDTVLGLRVVAATVAITTTFDVDVLLDVGGLAISPHDAAFGALFVAGVARMLRGRRLTDPQALLLAVFVVVVWSVLRGSQVAGVPGAVNEARKYVHVIGAALYFAPVPVSDREYRDEVVRTWIALGWYLAGLAAVRWVAFAAGISGGPFGDGDDLRTVPSAVAFLIAQGGLLSMLAPRTAPTWVRRAAPVLLGVAFLLQHRTVWIVMIVTLTVLVLRNRALSRRLAVAVVGGATVLVALSATVFAGSDIELAEEIEHAATSTGTFEWRLEGWSTLVLDRDRELEDWAFGEPFGSGWERRVRGLTWTVSPHNFYVESLLRIGVVGLALLLAVHARGLRRLAPRRWPDELLSAEGLFVLGVSLLVYYVPYAPAAEQSVVVGLLVAAGSLPRGGAAAAATDPPPFRAASAQTTAAVAEEPPTSHRTPAARPRPPRHQRT